MIIKPIKHPKLFSILLIAATIWALYSISLGHNFLFDEEDIILLNPHIHDFSSSWKLFGDGYFRQQYELATRWDQYYRPMTAFTFAIDCAYWGSNPMGYNITNTLLHIAVCVLFFFLLLKIFKDNHIVAFLGAFLYSIHTIHTEAVTYTASRGDLLSGLSCLSVLLLYWNPKNRKWAVLVYLVGLFCKEGAILIPAYIVLAELCFIKSDFKKIFKNILPFAAVALSYILFRKTLCPIPGPPPQVFHEALFRVMSMGTAMLDYFQALVYPEPFKYCGGVDFATKWNSVIIYTTVYVFGLLFFAWALAWRYRSAVFFGLSVFLIGMAPSYQVVHFFPEWAEHYMYIPYMGIVVMISSLLYHVLKSGRTKIIAATLIIYFCFSGFICYRTYVRNSYYVPNYKFYEALWDSESPYAYYGLVNMALGDVAKERWKKAYVPLKVALNINPDSEINNYNVGLYYFKHKKYRQAAEYYGRAYNSKTGSGQAAYLVHQAIALTACGEFEKAEAIYKVALKRLPNAAFVYKSLMRLYIYQKNYPKALYWAEEGLKHTPEGNPNHDIMCAESLLLGFIMSNDELCYRVADDILRNHKSPDWFLNIAKLIKNQASIKTYQHQIDTGFFLNQREARYYIIVSLVLNKKYEELAEYMKVNREEMHKKSGERIFTKRFLDRVDKELREHKPVS